MVKKAILFWMIGLLFGCESTATRSLYSGTDAAIIESKSSFTNMLTSSVVTQVLKVDGVRIGFAPARATVAPGERRVEIEWEVNEMTYNSNGTAGSLKRLGGGTEEYLIDAQPNRTYRILAKQGDPSRRDWIDFILQER